MPEPSTIRPRPHPPRVAILGSRTVHRITVDEARAGHVASHASARPRAPATVWVPARVAQELLRCFRPSLAGWQHARGAGRRARVELLVGRHDKPEHRRRREWRNPAPKVAVRHRVLRDGTGSASVGASPAANVQRQRCLILFSSATPSDPFTPFTAGAGTIVVGLRVHRCAGVRRHRAGSVYRAFVVVLGASVISASSSGASRGRCMKHRLTRSPDSNSSCAGRLEWA